MDNPDDLNKKYLEMVEKINGLEKFIAEAYILTNSDSLEELITLIKNIQEDNEINSNKLENYTSSLNSIKDDILNIKNINKYQVNKDLSHEKKY